MLGPSASELRAEDFYGGAPSDLVVERCGVSGGPALDDGEDLRLLCSAVVTGVERQCLTRSSIGIHRGRRRRQRRLVLPEALLPAAAGAAEDMEMCVREVGKAGVLNVLVLHHPSNAHKMGLYSEWITSHILPSFDRPLRIIQSEEQLPSERPVLNNSLVVAIAWDKQRNLNLGGYARMAGNRGARNLGLLHLNHECPPPHGCWYHNDDYADEYSDYDFVLRNYYSPRYAALSLFLPLGPVSNVLAGLPDVPTEASSRPNLCTTSFYVFHPEHNQERVELMSVLEKHRGLCSFRISAPEEYRSSLLSSAFTLCPAGNNVETFRHWEAAFAGSIVVMLKNSSNEAGSSFADALEAPFLFLRSWQELPGRLRSLQAAPAEMLRLQAAQQRWLAELRRDLPIRIRALLEARFKLP